MIGLALRALLRLAALLGVMLGAAWIALRAGFGPLPPLDLAEPAPRLIADLQIARLADDAALCITVFEADPASTATAAAPRPVADGCGWDAAVRLTRAGAVATDPGPLACGAAAAYALWLAHDVQPVAQRRFGVRIASVQDLGGYACRDIMGRNGPTGRRSQHARANAVDVAGFTLEDGRRISVLRDWGDGEAGAFLREVFRAGCRRFSVALGPDYNAAHRDHFHFDRGPASVCR